jgi:curved DNA-binding protein CbpA
MIDYYQVLEVPSSATQEEIRKAYRRLVKKFHPDVNKNPGAEGKFKRIATAYEILSKPEVRANYDLSRSGPTAPIWTPPTASEPIWAPPVPAEPIRPKKTIQELKEDLRKELRHYKNFSLADMPKQKRMEYIDGLSQKDFAEVLEELKRSN